MYKIPQKKVIRRLPPPSPICLPSITLNKSATQRLQPSKSHTPGNNVLLELNCVLESADNMLYVMHTNCKYISSDVSFIIELLHSGE